MEKEKKDAENQVLAPLPEMLWNRLIFMCSPLNRAAAPRGAGVALTLQRRPAQRHHLDVGGVVAVAGVGLCEAVHVQQLPVGHLPIGVEDLLSFPHWLCCNHPQTVLQAGRGEQLSCADLTAQQRLSESSGLPELLLTKHAAGLCFNEIQARLAALG